ncbi:hypothetical protein EXE44_05990 [Halorubrum sp. SS7]|uniref:hypothetical protein n=1 Tax=Halorubrum sp. SS7 TaxID=2518119 RepID=UPI0010F83A8B|nr:hypothetical protein [Halorubrum sp. SS7]TKX59093.1 hypothetical protein EXE44_05990 [Halorubrum sp. SS7]
MVVLAGCGGLAGGDEAPGAGIETEGAANASGVDTEPEETFQIDSFNPTYLLDYNESQAGTVRITNVGSDVDTGTVTVTFRGRELLNESVSLEPNESVERSFRSEPLRLPEGEHELEARIGDENVTRSFSVDEHPSPYGKTNVSLYVNDTRVDRNITEIVRNSTAFWERNAEDTAGYPIEFRFVDNRSAADQALVYRDVTECGDITNQSLNGCANLATGYRGTVWGSVQYNLSNPELEYTTTHELGHMLGLDHDDPPDYVMNISRISWTPNTTRVAFRDADGGDLDAQTKQEAVEALDELTRRDVDAMYGFRWREVSSPEEAHIVIAGNDSVCSPGFESAAINNSSVRPSDAGGASCVGELDYENQLTIALDDLDAEVVSWHVAHQLVPLTYHEAPPDLKSDTDRREREDWPGSVSDDDATDALVGVAPPPARA